LISDADIFKPDEVLNDEVVRRRLDFSEPVALFQIGTLHHYDGARSPQSIMAEYINAVAQHDGQWMVRTRPEIEPHVRRSGND
jgi:S-adenosyl methyltransferase